MKLDHLFPIPIVRITVDPTVVNNTVASVEQYIESEKLLETESPHRELLTTFYNHKDFLGKINNQELLKFINSKAREFLNLRGFNPKCFLEITSWLQLYPTGTHFNKHDHYGAMISGVLYLKAPVNCGNIRFYNPNIGRRATDVFFERLKINTNEYNYHYVEYTPIEGEMVMFESWLEHSVDMNLSTENRIAISFNIWGDDIDAQR
jgi:uncharacterized protein (TIGR02466 family)|tara:strand:- start:425 stop:1042 length:618 start_codon:yes stop_codon:yes gene_type:complete